MSEPTTVIGAACPIKMSNPCDVILGIFARIQAKVEPIRKNKTVTIGNDDKGWESGYATLEALEKVIDPLIREEGLVVFQTTEPTGKDLMLVTLFTDAKSQQWIANSYPIREGGKGGGMGTGSGLSFAQRWLRVGAFALKVYDKEQGEGYKQLANANRPARKGAAPRGIADLVASIEGAESLEHFIAAANAGRAAHPTGEGAHAVDKAIDAWYVARIDDPEVTVPQLSELAAANRGPVKSRGSTVREAFMRADRRTREAM